MPFVQVAYAGAFNVAVSATNPSNTSTVFAVPKLWNSGLGLLTSAPPYAFIQSGFSTQMHPGTGITRMFTKEATIGGRLLTFCIYLYMPGRGQNSQATFVRSNALTTAWYGSQTSITAWTDSSLANVSPLGGEFADLVHNMAAAVIK